MFANDGTNIFEKENNMGESSFFSRFGLKMRREGGSWRALPVKPNQGLHLSIFSPARSGHGPYWTGVVRDLAAREKNSWPEPSPKYCF
jgi:hypothetical protein